MRPWLRSDFSHDKVLLAFAFFHPVWPARIRRLIFAFNANLGYIAGKKVPFYELFDLSSQTEAGGTEVLGGARSLRGYRDYRFAGPLTALINAELRLRLKEFMLLRQHMSLNVVSFFDTGRICEHPCQLSLHDYRYSYGLGLRLGWNLSTILLRGYWL